MERITRRGFLKVAGFAALNALGISAACDQKLTIQGLKNNPNPDSQNDPKVPPVALNPPPTSASSEVKATPTARIAERPTPNPAGTSTNTDERGRARSKGLDFTSSSPSPRP